MEVSNLRIHRVCWRAPFTSRFHGFLTSDVIPSLTECELHRAVCDFSCLPRTMNFGKRQQLCALRPGCVLALRRAFPSPLLLVHPALFAWHRGWTRGLSDSFRLVGSSLVRGKSPCWNSLRGRWLRLDLDRVSVTSVVEDWFVSRFLRFWSSFGRKP